MDRMLQKKINLLLHLAGVDGEFAESERELLKSILREKGLEESYLNEHQREVVSLDQIKAMPDKAELLYWVIRTIQADSRLHSTELLYSKIIARQLGFKEEVIDHYAAKGMTSLAEFEEEVKKFQFPAA